MSVNVESLKEQYLETLEIFQSLTLPASKNKEFRERFSEVKELKNNAVNRTSKVSKTYLLKQSSTKLAELKSELLELKKSDEIKRYKDEVENLKTIFKNKKLTKKEKLYMAKKVGEINDFDLKNWKSYIKNESKLFSESITDGIQSSLMSGL